MNTYLDVIEQVIVRDWAQKTTNMMYSSYGMFRSIYKTKDKEETRYEGKNSIKGNR